MTLRLSIKDLHMGREYRQDVEFDGTEVITEQKLWESYNKMIERMDVMKEDYKNIPLPTFNNPENKTP